MVHVLSFVVKATPTSLNCIQEYVEPHPLENICTPSYATLLSLEAMPIDPFLLTYLIHHTRTHTHTHYTTHTTLHTQYSARETSNEKVCFYVHKVLRSEKLLKQCLKIEDVVS